MSSSRPPGAPARRPVRRPRRPPAHVFWVRRLLALGVVGGLVWTLVALVGMLDLSADGETETPQATTAGATPSPTPEAGTDADALARAERRAAARALRAAERAQENGDLVEPSGPCAPGDVVVTPKVTDAQAAAPVTVVLELTTESTPACTWTLDPDEVFVTIEDDSATLWSSQDCPDALPTTAAVPRSSTPDTVRFTWDGKESAPGCAVDTSWLWPGVYKITAVARGSVDPVETLFTLGPNDPTAPDDGTADGTDDADASESDDEAGDDTAAGRRAGEDTADEDEADEDTADSEPETEEQAAERRENRREALREARRQHRQDDGA